MKFFKDKSRWTVTYSTKRGDIFKWVVYSRFEFWAGVLSAPYLRSYLSQLDHPVPIRQWEIMCINNDGPDIKQ